MEWRKTDGGIVDAELLRPRDWVASSHLEIGSIFKVFSTELELNGIAEITAISLCPPLSTGDGEVVTGRFVTRRADETVRMTFETGDTLEGSKSHPIWSPAIQDWVPMGEWAAEDVVLGREGWIAVTSVEVRNESVSLYNIEVRGEHVYEVTQAGILVHNSTPCSVNPGNFDAPNPVVKSAGDLFEERVKNTFSKEIIRQNEILRNSAGKVIGEIDFETAEAIAEVGLSLRGKVNQLHRLAEIAKQRGKRLDVIYGPDTSPGTFKFLQESLAKKWGNRVRFIPHE